VISVLKNSQLMVVSCGLAFQAFILVLLNTFVAQLAGADAIWIAFQAWAVYFLAGCTPMGGVKAWIGYGTGVVASIAIIALMGAPGISSLPSVGGMNLVMAVAVFLVVIPAIMSENLKNMVPALFIGSGAFFGLSGLMDGAGHLAVARAELVYCAVGLLFGCITVYWRGKYEATLKK
jgi:hypothetical protein